jgi:hypothetical protein
LPPIRVDGVKFLPSVIGINGVLGRVASILFLCHLPSVALVPTPVNTHVIHDHPLMCILIIAMHMGPHCIHVEIPLFHVRPMETLAFPVTIASLNLFLGQSGIHVYNSMCTTNCWHACNFESHSLMRAFQCRRNWTYRKPYAKDRAHNATFGGKHEVGFAWTMQRVRVLRPMHKIGGKPTVTKNIGLRELP